MSLKTSQITLTQFECNRCAKTIEQDKNKPDMIPAGWTELDRYIGGEVSGKKMALNTHHLCGRCSAKYSGFLVEGYIEMAKAEKDKQKPQYKHWSDPLAWWDPLRKY